MKFFLLLLSAFSIEIISGQSNFTETVAFSPDRNIQIINHAFYKIGFDVKEKLPAYAYYLLTKEHLALANLERKGSFVKDPLLNQEQACSDDYAGSGFDKGHLVPCEDMSFSEQAMKETFYYSNCAPQTTELNRGEWKVVEELVREWAIDFGEAIIICGPVFKPIMKKMGVHDIPVPDSYFKIITIHKENQYSSLAFIMPNSVNNLMAPINYTCTIDSIEKVTGLDFFAAFPDNLEEQFENRINVKDWNWKIHHSTAIVNKTDSLRKNSNENNYKEPVQCKGKTKKGKQCSKKTTSLTGYCKLHGG